jgi:hypothetical protein
MRRYTAYAGCLVGANSESGQLGSGIDRGNATAMRQRVVVSTDVLR